MELTEKLKLLPTNPGVYLMKNEAGEILYIGKALNLRNRVRSYFQNGRGLSAKVAVLVGQIEDFEYIVTDSEVEALILESNLIKEHAPRYNVRLKDDKNYPYIKVSMEETFPRVLLVRRRLADGGRYFGPYTSAGAVRDTLDLLRKLFPVRTCRKRIEPGQQDRPCLNFHIGRCLAPCASLIDAAAYREIIDEVCVFLEGRHDALIPDLEVKMNQAAGALEFERAARIRDQLQSLRQIVEKQKIVASHAEDQDVLGYARAGDLACVHVFFVRGGKLIGRDHFLLDCSPEEDGEAVLAAFVQQYYSKASFVPREILLSQAVDDGDVLENWLGTLRGSRVYLRTPQRGAKKHLVNMVTENAQIVLDEIRSKEERRQREVEMGLSELQEALDLPAAPRRIEAYDISNTQGNQVVASMVVFVDGMPANDQYRRFRIRTVEGGPDDYQAMQEVLRRRFSRGLREKAGEIAGSSFSDFPDVVLVDGGKGQLSSALEVRDELAVDVPFVGLAKQFEELYREGQQYPVLLPRESQGLFMLQRIRDEAHRFAITYHRQLRGRAAQGSVLDDIPGVGSQRKKALIKYFGSVKRIREAEIEELVKVDGVSRGVAEEIYRHLRG